MSALILCIPRLGPTTDREITDIKIFPKRKPRGKVLKGSSPKAHQFFLDLVILSIS